MLIIIFIYVLNVINPSEVNSKLSLTSTLASIALAVIAILFSFVQSSDSSTQHNALIGKVSQLSVTIVGLQGVSDSLEKKNENKINAFEELQIKIEEVFDNMESRLKSFKISSDGISEIDSVKDETLSKLEILKNNNSITSSITIFGPKSLLNLINNMDKEKNTFHVQMIWNELQNKGVNIPLNQVRGALKVLEIEGSIKLIGINRDIIQVVDKQKGNL
ncbi:hypothetical protein [Paenibacillus sp.]|uniref:hypothetical protein n=1 Tax=Paenibacillus sp. TaxID=58172 RepID=UPI0028A5DEAE|nr:hypothetical protein [Paenibacillus sp.]